MLCFNQDSGKFTITAIVSEELLEAGFVGKVVYVRGEPTQSIAVTNKHWLRFDRFRGQRCSFEDIQTRARKVLSLVYTKTVPGVPDANIAVLKSMLPIRQDLLEGLPPSSVIPLPCYFYEKSVCLASPPAVNCWKGLFCIHKRLLISYYDLYPPKKYKNLLYKGEYANIQNSRTLRPEREQIRGGMDPHRSKLLLGSTLLPVPVVESILESQPEGRASFQLLKQAWENPSCSACLSYFTKLKLTRSVERYLFLKYQTKEDGTVSNRISSLGKVLVINRSWAHAWMEYMFYDTDLYYQLHQNKNYELPLPPVKYEFKSNQNTSMLEINIFHGYIIRKLYTDHHEATDVAILAKAAHHLRLNQPQPRNTVFLSEKDEELLFLAETNQLSDTICSLLERHTSKMIHKITGNPEYWALWLSLFEEENIYEETCPNRETNQTQENQSVSTQVKEMSTIEKLPGLVGSLGTTLDILGSRPEFQQNMSKWLPLNQDFDPTRRVSQHNRQGSLRDWIAEEFKHARQEQDEELLIGTDRYVTDLEPEENMQLYTSSGRKGHKQSGRTPRHTDG